jgi:hypothetical protein
MNAQRVYRVVHELNGNALIYCNQGASGTSILSSLAQIFCDPYYRTFEGFKVLVHKDWVFYKHDFARKSQLVREYVIKDSGYRSAPGHVQPIDQEAGLSSGYTLSSQEALIASKN